MKVVIKKVNRELEVVEINGELEQMQEIVGGFIERIEIPMLSEHKIDLYINEEGKLFDLDDNVALIRNNTLLDIIKGDFFMIGYLEDTGENCSLSDEQISFISNNLFANSYAVMLDDKILKCIKV